MKGTIVIVGLGLIGGSIALAIKAKHPEAHIIGIDVSYHSLEVGKSLGVIDEIGESILIDGPKADLLIFCCPVKETEQLLMRLPGLRLKENVIVTDTGSTKGTIMEASTALRESGITFIGGHPMAGSHKSGVRAAKELLFENAYYLLTPTKDVTEDNVTDLKTWLSGTNAKFLVLSPNEHDEITGMLSHLPHIVAAALVNQTQSFTEEHPAAFRLAAGGFRDITRVASSDPRMWTDISISNKKTLTKQLTIWRDSMNQALEMLESEDATLFTPFLMGQKNFEIHFQFIKAVRFHLFTIYLSTYQIILGLSLR